MDPCQAWTELFSSKDRGRINDYFIRERNTLTDHLKDCTSCTLFLNLVDDIFSQNPDSVKSLSNIQFAQLIRELYKKYQKVRTS